jgi:hypothetical protein
VKEAKNLPPGGVIAHDQKNEVGTWRTDPAGWAGLARSIAGKAAETMPEHEAMIGTMVGHVLRKLPPEQHMAIFSQAKLWAVHWRVEKRMGRMPADWNPGASFAGWLKRTDFSRFDEQGNQVQ